MSMDYKILPKSLATRLESVSPQIISPDQTVFISNQHSGSNLRRLPPIGSSSPSYSPERVYHWMLKKPLGLEESFTSWIKLLYSLSTISLSPHGQGLISSLYSSICSIIISPDSLQDVRRSTLEGKQQMIIGRPY